MTVDELWRVMLRRIRKREKPDCPSSCLFYSNDRLFSASTVICVPLHDTADEYVYKLVCIEVAMRMKETVDTLKSRNDINSFLGKNGFVFLRQGREIEREREREKRKEDSFAFLSRVILHPLVPRLDLHSDT